MQPEVLVLPVCTFDAIAVRKLRLRSFDPCFWAAFEFAWHGLGICFDDVFDVPATAYRARVAGVMVGLIVVDDARLRTIRLMYFDPEWRGNGLAAALLAHVKQARNEPNGWTPSGNPVSAVGQKFMERHGIAFEDSL